MHFTDCLIKLAAFICSKLFILINNPYFRTMMSQLAIAARVLKFLSGLRAAHRDHVMHIEIECEVKYQHDFTT